jgi:hypothetical protein
MQPARVARVQLRLSSHEGSHRQDQPRLWLSTWVCHQTHGCGSCHLLHHRRLGHGQVCSDKREAGVDACTAEAAGCAGRRKQSCAAQRTAVAPQKRQHQAISPGVAPALTAEGSPSTAKYAARSSPRLKHTLHCMRWLEASPICAPSRTSPARTSPSLGAGQGGSIGTSPPSRAACSCSTATASAATR